MERVNLAMMGLMGLILLIGQENQRHPRMESACYVLKYYLSQKIIEKID